MKKIIYCIVLFLSIQSFAQETSTQNIKTTSSTSTDASKGQLNFDVVRRVYYGIPVQTGNHVWKDAYDAGFSIGTSLGILEFANFRLSGGLEYEKYNVTDVSKAGNFKLIIKENLFLSISHDLKLNEKFMLVPNIGYGSNYVKHKTPSIRFANQVGNHFRIGAYFDFSLGGSVGVFGGIHYIRNKFDISTNSEYSDYFTKSSQFQFTLGLKVH